MAEVTKRRTGEFVQKLFEILTKHPEGLPARESLNALKNSFQLSDYEKGAYKSGTQRFEQIVRFATVDCVKSGWLLKQKGKWILTDAGRAAYKAMPDPEDLYRRAVKLYHQWKASQPDPETDSTEDPGDETSKKAISITFEQAQEKAWDEIEQYFKQINPYDFQELVASLLRAMGYHIAWIAPPGKDGGVDILALTDPLGTRPPRIKVQVKRVAQNISVEVLRSFMAILSDDEVGLFVTTSGFTKDAQDEARSQSKRKVTLIDLEKLFDLWVEHYVRLSDDARSRLPLKPIYFLAPEN